MAVKDKMKLFFIKYILLPKMEIINHPGFIAIRFTEKKRETYLRDIFLPESLFVDLENEIVKKFKDIGKQRLYSAGKKFAFFYIKLSNFPKKNELTNEEFIKFADDFIKFVGTTWSESIDYEMDVKNETIILKIKNYPVCRKNGLGYIFSYGALAGVWSSVLDNKSLEGIQISCQNKNNEYCKILCGPPEKLSKKNITVFKEKDLVQPTNNLIYNQINQIRDISSSNTSLKDLIDSRIFNYNFGKLTFKNERFIECESSIIYFLENEICKLKNGKKILFDVSFNTGRKIAKISEEKDYIKFVPRFLSSLGWGDINILNKDKKIYIISNFFPWIDFKKEIKFIIFRGLVSGMMFEFTKKKRLFSNIENSIIENNNKCIFY